MKHEEQGRQKRACVHAARRTGEGHPFQAVPPLAPLHVKRTPLTVVTMNLNSSILTFSQDSTSPERAGLKSRTLGYIQQRHGHGSKGISLVGLKKVECGELFLPKNSKNRRQICYPGFLSSEMYTLHKLK